MRLCAEGRGQGQVDRGRGAFSTEGSWLGKGRSCVRAVGSP